MSSSFPRPKPKPGSLPLERKEEFGPAHPAQYAIPPFIPADELERVERARERVSRKTFQSLKVATNRVEKLREAVRDDAFDEWVRRCTVASENPRDWTQAAMLYASYLRQAKAYGWNRADKQLSKRELATETRFGILLRDAGFIKTRRTRGWYYPLRLKQGT